MEFSLWKTIKKFVIYVLVICMSAVFSVCYAEAYTTEFQYTPSSGINETVNSEESSYADSKDNSEYNAENTDTHKETDPPHTGSMSKFIVPITLLLITITLAAFKILKAK